MRTDVGLWDGCVCVCVCSYSYYFRQWEKLRTTYTIYINGETSKENKIGVPMAIPMTSKGLEIPRSLLPLTTLRCREWQKTPQTVLLAFQGHFSRLNYADTRTCHWGKGTLSWGRTIYPRAFALIEIEVILKVSEYPRKLVTMHFFKTLISQSLISDKYWLVLIAKRHKWRLSTEPESNFGLTRKKLKLHYKVVNLSSESRNEQFLPTPGFLPPSTVHQEPSR